MGNNTKQTLLVKRAMKMSTTFVLSLAILTVATFALPTQEEIPDAVVPETLAQQSDSTSPGVIDSQSDDCDSVACKMTGKMVHGGPQADAPEDAPIVHVTHPDGS